MLGSAIKAGEAFIKMTLYDGALRQGLTRVKLQLMRFGNSLAAVGRAAALFAVPIVAGFATTVKAAADTEEWLNRFKVIFGELGGEAEDFANRLARSIGRSTIEIKNQLGTLQSFWEGLNFSPQKALQYSEVVSQLTYDLASFHNIADKEAQEKILSALSGEPKPLREFGIALGEAAVAVQMLKDGYTGLASEAPMAVKAVARLNIIRDVMGRQGAIGDAERTLGSFTNQMKRLKALAFEARAAIGQALTPSLTGVVKVLGSATEGIKRWAQENENAGSTIVETTLAVAGLTAAVWALGKAFVFAGAVTGFFAGGPIKKVIIAAGLVTAAMFDWSKAIKSVKEELGDLAQTLETGDFELVGRQIGIAIRMGVNEGMKSVAENIREAGKSPWVFWPGGLEEFTYFADWVERRADESLESLHAKMRELKKEVAEIQNFRALAQSQPYQDWLRPFQFEGFWMQPNQFGRTSQSKKIGFLGAVPENIERIWQKLAKAGEPVTAWFDMLEKGWENANNKMIFVWREFMSNLRWSWLDFKKEWDEWVEGTKLFEETRNPLERAMTRLERLVELRKKGKITPEVFDRAVDQLKEDLTQELQLPSGGVGREGLLGGARAGQVFTDDVINIDKRQLEELIKIRRMAEKKGLINQPVFSGG